MTRDVIDDDGAAVAAADALNVAPVIVIVDTVAVVDADVVDFVDLDVVAAVANAGPVSNLLLFYSDLDFFVGNLNLYFDFVYYNHHC